MAKLPLSPVNPANQGTLINTLREWFGAPNDYSSAGKQRVENVKARAHATSERLAAQAFNAEQAQIAREFDERMANTSYQRAVADMKAAGINPMFAISQGGAYSPSSPSASIGASPSGANATRDDLPVLFRLVGLILSGFTTASAMAARQTKSVLDLSKAALASSQTGLALANTNLAKENILLTQARVNNLNANTGAVAGNMFKKSKSVPEWLGPHIEASRKQVAKQIKEIEKNALSMEELDKIFNPKKKM